MPSVEYPAFFDDGLMGFRATKKIKHREMIIAVPYEIVMSNHKALEDPILGKVFKENPALFGEEGLAHNNLVLTIFLLYEMQKGK